MENAPAQKHVERDANASPGSRKLLIPLLVAATVGLAALVTLLAVQNRSLKLRLANASAPVMPASLEVGRAVAPLEVIDRAGTPTTLLFAGQAPSTLVIVLSGSCPSCEKMLPVWVRQIDRASNPRVRIVCIQTDAPEPDYFEKLEQPWPLYGIPKGRRGWIRDVPIVPLTLLLDSNGVITHAWPGQMDEPQAESFMFALVGAGATADASKGGG